MSDEDDIDGIVFEGRRYPDDVEPLDQHVYEIPFKGGTNVRDLGWKGHVKIAHEAGVESMETEIIDAGYDPDGVKYAAAKVTLYLDGNRFSAVQAADTTTNQVRDEEFVYSVAESRALKRAVKKALNIYPLDPELDEEKARLDEARQARHRREEGPDVDVETEEPPTKPGPEGETRVESYSGDDDDEDEDEDERDW